MLHMDASLSEDIVVALDPGREKCGLAVLTLDGKVLSREVTAPDLVPQAVESLLGCRKAEALVIGNGTAKQGLLDMLGESLLLRFRDGVAEVDEHLSSVEARRRYLDDHPPRGIARLIPKGLRTPAEPIDDYAAVVLAERYLEARRATLRGSPESDQRDGD